MEWAIDELIAFLLDLRSDPLLAQVMTIIGIPSSLALIFALPAWLMRRKVEASVTLYESTKQALETAQREAARLSSALHAERDRGPEKFVEVHRAHMKANEIDHANSAARKYVEQQKEALLIAFTTLMSEAIAQSAEDGAASFELASAWARAALALDGEDRLLIMTAAELEHATVAAGSGASVRLSKSEAARERVSRFQGQTEEVEQILVAGQMHIAAVRFSLLLPLAEVGRSIASKPPFGVGSMVHLLFSDWLAKSLNECGFWKDALKLSSEIVDTYSSSFSPQETIWINARATHVENLLSMGEFATAERLAGDLVHDTSTEDLEMHRLSSLSLQARAWNSMGKHGDALHAFDKILEFPFADDLFTSVAAYRFHRAAALFELGEFATARDELTALLIPLSKKIGNDASRVLRVRATLADLDLSLGRKKDALEDIVKITAAMARSLHTQDPLFSAGKVMLGRALRENGKPDDAAAILQDAVENLTTTFGHDHHATIEAATELAMVHREQGTEDPGLSKIEGMLATLNRKGVFAGRVVSNLIALRDAMTGP